MLGASLREEMMPKIAAREWARRWGPEAALAVLAGVMFLGFLGAIDLWGKREQRASAEAIDTIDQDHWLVAQIQGRPRLEKPPLPRWTIATLMRLTGRRDEWMVRLPSALAALGMVGLVYGLGCRLGGRPVGLASGLALTSIVFFITELRQAGNDGPLAFFTTLGPLRRLAAHQPGGGRRSRGVRTRYRAGHRPWRRPGSGMELCLLRRPRARVPEQGANRLDPGGAGPGPLPRADRPASDGPRLAGRRLGLAPVRGAGSELADPGLADRPQRRAGLVPGDGSEGGDGGDQPSPAPRDPRRRVGLDDGAVGRPGVDRRPPSVPAERTGRAAPALVPLVLGGPQPADVLLLVGRQAELLSPLPARRGPPDRDRVGSHDAGGARPGGADEPSHGGSSSSTGWSSSWPPWSHRS